MLIVWVALIALIVWLVWPIKTGGLTSSPNPAVDYDAALKALEAWRIREDDLGLHDVCRSKLFSHGRKTEHAVLIFHGYTTCPEQFAELGLRFYGLGYNVFIPCLDHHGRADRLTDELKNLTAEDMASDGDRSLDVARGLGEKVTVLGISGGGTIAAWLGQNRADVDFAVPLAACIGLAFLPSFLTTPFIRIFTALPHFFIWWDPRTKAENPYSIFYAYPRYPMSSLAQVLRLGLAVKAQSRRQPPAAGHILIMINDSEPAVSNTELNNLYKGWSRNAVGRVSAYHFVRAMKMPHDIITPGTPGVPTEEVFTRIIEQVTAMTEHKNTPAKSG